MSNCMYKLLDDAHYKSTHLKIRDFYFRSEFIGYVTGIDVFLRSNDFIYYLLSPGIDVFSRRSGGGGKNTVYQNCSTRVDLPTPAIFAQDRHYYLVMGSHRIQNRALKRRVPMRIRHIGSYGE